MTSTTSIHITWDPATRALTIASPVSPDAWGLDPAAEASPDMQLAYLVRQFLDLASGATREGTS